MNSFIKYYIDTELNNLKTLIVGSAPEALDTLKELADAISGDPEFFSTMSAANAALQTAVDAVQADVDQNEADADAAIAAETSARTVAVTGEATTRQAAIDAVNALITTLQTEAAARDTRITTLEADATTATAVAAVQADVDQNETDSDTADAALSARLDVLEADPTTQTLLDAETARATSAEGGLATDIAAVQADVDQNESDADAAIAVERGRIDAILAGADADKDTFAEIVTLINSVDTENDNTFAAYVLSNDAAVAAVQADVDQNETDSDAAEAALSGRLDTLEADPTTATAVAAVQADVDQNEVDGDAADAALSGRLDTLEADPTTQTALDAEIARATSVEGGLATDKLNVANPAATGQLTVDTNARVQFDSNLTKVENVLRGTGIEIGNNIQMKPAGAGGRVEVAGGFQIDITEVPEYSNDTQAAAGGVIVGGLYRSGSVLHIRVS